MNVPAADLRCAPMRVALFVPCYVDQLWPEVGLAALDAARARAASTVVVSADADLLRAAVPHARARGEDARALAVRFVARVRALTTRSSRRRGAASRCCARISAHARARPRGARRSRRACSSCASSWPHVLPALRRRARRRRSRTASRCTRAATRCASCASARRARARAAAPSIPRARCSAALAGLELVALARARRVLRLRRRLRGRGGAVSCRMGARPARGSRAPRAPRCVTSTDVSCLLHLERRSRDGAASPLRAPARGARSSPGASRRRDGARPPPSAPPRSSPTPRARTGTTQALWFVREKRDRAAARCPSGRRCASAAAAIKRHTLARLPELPRGASRRDATRARRAWCTGRATRPSTTRSCSGCCAGAARDARREEQVDAHRGVRAQPVPRSARHRGRRHRPRRAHRAAAPRAAEPHRDAGDPPARRRRSASCSTRELGSAGRARRPDRSSTEARAARTCARASSRREAGITGVELRDRRDAAASSSAPTRATPTSAPRCRRSTSPAWASRS